jgi:hypothetical protein
MAQQDSINIQKCYANLGILYKKTGDTLRSIQISKKSLEICEGLGDHRHALNMLQKKPNVEGYTGKTKNNIKKGG